MKAVHFGAGNIGRGFIGLLLVRSGCDVTFVDVNQDLVRLIKERGRYTVRLLSDPPATEVVEGVTALDAKDIATVARAIAEADLVTTSVGPSALVQIAPAIAEGIRLREPGRPLSVIACENMVNAGDALREAVLAHVGEAPGVSFPNGVVDRIVPRFTPEPGEDPLLIAVEPYYEWRVDRKGFVGPVPAVMGMQVVDNLPAYMERKLYGLNMGHAVVAYLGYLRGYAYIHEAVKDPMIRATLMTAFVEEGLALVHRHGFTEAEQAQYATKLLERFGNPLLHDSVIRVGRDPKRKLGPADRLVGPAKLALEEGIYPRGLARGIAAGYLFDPAEDTEALALAEQVRAEGLTAVLPAVSGVAPDSPLGRLICQEYELLTDMARVA